MSANTALTISFSYRAALELSPADTDAIGYLANTLRLRVRTSKKPLRKVAKEAVRLYTLALDLGSQDMEMKKGTIQTPVKADARFWL
jgi:hypothetical protein